MAINWNWRFALLGKKKPTRKNRLKKNIQKKRNRLVHRLLTGAKLLALMGVILAVSALFMAGYAAVTSTAYFSTQSIAIEGQSRLSRQVILSQAAIREGDNLLAVNLKLVRKRLLAHPWIAAARVAREIPETISIAVTEHAPLAVLDLGRKFLLNTHGRIFKEYGPDDPGNLPLVTGIAYGDISLGDDALGPNMAAVLKVIQVSKAKKSALPYDRIKEIHMDAEMGITLYVWDNRRTVKLGLDGYAAKYERIRQLLPYLRQDKRWRTFTAIDANNPDRIVVQL
jgi:cell division protein FtsQ